MFRSHSVAFCVCVCVFMFGFSFLNDVVFGVYFAVCMCRSHFNICLDLNSGLLQPDPGSISTTSLAASARFLVFQAFLFSLDQSVGLSPLTCMSLFFAVLFSVSFLFLSHFCSHVSSHLTCKLSLQSHRRRGSVSCVASASLVIGFIGFVSVGCVGFIIGFVVG